LEFIVDATLAKTKDAIVFSESFELAVPRGFDSLAVTMKNAPTGASVGTLAPIVETNGW
jgi:hypothetical protein